MVSIVLVLALLAPCVSVQQNDIPADAGARFGPSGCIRVTKSPFGSCVISTKCEGLDTSATEFAFNCVSKKGVKWHSFGVGGFETNEEFDSEVKCDRCEISFAKHVQVAAAVRPVFVQPSTHAPLTTALPKKAPGVPTRAPQLPFGGAPLIHPLPVFMAPIAKAMPPAYPESSYRFLHTKAPPAEQSAKQRHRVKYHKLKHHNRQAPDSVGFFGRLRTKAVGFFGRLRKKQRSVAGQKSEIVPVSSFHAMQHTRKAEIAKAGVNFWPFARSNSQREAIQTKPKIAKYGPDDCVSTYRNSLGECVVQTKCKGIDVSDYEFGLRCVDKAGKSVHHTFGMRSFDQEETFDTLIKCDKCLGLTDKHKEVVAKEVAEVSKAIEELAASAKDLSANVAKLNVAVFKKKAAAPAGAAPAAAPAGVVAAVLIDKTSPPQGRAGAYVQKGSGNDDEDDDEDESDDQYAVEQVVTKKAKKIQVEDDGEDESEDLYAVATPKVATQKKVRESGRDEETDEDDEESEDAYAVQEDKQMKSKPEQESSTQLPKLGQMKKEMGAHLRLSSQKKEGKETDDDGDDDDEEEADDDEWRVEKDDEGADDKDQLKSNTDQESSKRSQKGSDRKEDEGVEFNADEAEREYKEEANQHGGKRGVASDDGEDEDEVGADDDDDNFR